MTDTANLGITQMVESQAGKTLTFNEAIWLLDAVTQSGIIDKDLTAPPGSPTAGDVYVPGPSSTGAWSGHDGKIAYYANTTWYFLTPKEGWMFWVNDENVRYIYTGAAWQAVGDVLNNYTAIVVPTINDDSGDGYAIGSKWVDTVTKAAFVLVDATVGAAVWVTMGTATFTDAVFTVIGDVDGTKKIQVDVDTNVPTGTTVIITMPAASLDLNNVYSAGGTDVAIADGGTGAGTAQAAIDALTAVGAATNEHVLTKDTATGNAIWKVSTGGGGGSVFADDVFIVEGSVDATKDMMFDVDTNVPTGTVVTISAPSVDLDMDTIYLAGGTDVAIADGGTGASTAQAAIDALTAVSAATAEHVLTKDTASGNAIWKAAAGGGGSGSTGSGPITHVNSATWKLTIDDCPGTGEILYFKFWEDAAHSIPINPYGNVCDTVSNNGGSDTQLLDETNQTWFTFDSPTVFTIDMPISFFPKGYSLAAKPTATSMPYGWTLSYSHDGGTTWIEYDVVTSQTWSSSEVKDFTPTIDDFPSSPTDGDLYWDETALEQMRYDAATTSWLKADVPTAVLDGGFHASRIFRFITQLPASTGEIQYLKFWADAAMTTAIDMSGATVSCDVGTGGTDVSLFTEGTYSWWSGTSTPSIWSIENPSRVAPQAISIGARSSATLMTTDFLVQVSHDNGNTWHTLVAEFGLSWTSSEVKDYVLTEQSYPEFISDGEIVFEKNAQRTLRYDEDAETFYPADEKVVNALPDSTATEDIDFALGQEHSQTLAVATTTFSFTNPPRAGYKGSFVLQLTQDATGSRLVTWPASVDWPGGTAPTLTTAAASVDIFEFWTIDGGTTWFGVTLGLDMK